MSDLRKPLPSDFTGKPYQTLAVFMVLSVFPDIEGCPIVIHGKSHVTVFIEGEWRRYEWGALSDLRTVSQNEFVMTDRAAAEYISERCA